MAWLGRHRAGMTRSAKAWSLSDDYLIWKKLLVALTALLTVALV